jgi:hypothetical protein
MQGFCVKKFWEEGKGVTIREVKFMDRIHESGDRTLTGFPEERAKNGT